MLPILLFSQKIWDEAHHNAFTDLILFRGKWLCVFRESNQHEKSRDGIVRMIASSDTVTWSSMHMWQMDGIDLRDPKLSITPDGKLMLLVGGSVYENGVYQQCQTHVSFSSNGLDWNPLQPILQTNEWLWRVSWHDGKAYGISYRFSDPHNKRKEWYATLFSSIDGVNYNYIVDMAIPGQPNESTIRFSENGEMMALVRREMNFHDEAWIGRSEPPYTDWRWSVARYHLGGPNFLILPNGKRWAAGRYKFATPYGRFAKTILTEIREGSDGLVDFAGIGLLLPSGGDTSYPGMFYADGFIWMSYYSSHEGKSAVYFAKIQP